MGTDYLFKDMITMFDHVLLAKKEDMSCKSMWSKCNFKTAVGVLEHIT